MKQRYKGCSALCNYVLCILTISLFILCTRFSPTGANQKIDRLKKITKDHHFLQILLCIYNSFSYTNYTISTWSDCKKSLATV